MDADLVEKRKYMLRSMRESWGDQWRSKRRSLTRWVDKRIAEEQDKRDVPGTIEWVHAEDERLRARYPDFHHRSQWLMPDGLVEQILSVLEDVALESGDIYIKRLRDQILKVQQNHQAVDFPDPAALFRMSFEDQEHFQ